MLNLVSGNVELHWGEFGLPAWATSLSFNISNRQQSLCWIRNEGFTSSTQYLVNSSTVDPEPPYSGGRTWFLMFFAMTCHHFFVLDMISTSGPSSATTALKSPCVCKRSPVWFWSFVIVFHLWMDVVALAHLLLLQSLKVTLISKYEFWIPS